MRRVGALVPIALALLAIGQYFEDLHARDPILAAMSQFTMDIRRPIDKELVGYAPSADIASQVLAGSAISDALGSTRLTSLSQGERRAWLDVPVYLGDELSTAIDRSLDAAERNPGWPLHRYFVGKLAYTRDRRSVGGRIEPLKWTVPLESAYRSAPNHEAAVETLAGVLLEASKVLPENDKAMLPEVLGSAFVDPQFVRLAFDVSIDVAGREVAFASLPDEPAPLLEATRTLGRKGDIPGAADLYDRWEEAEWRSRGEDLDATQMRLARGDWKGLMAAATLWGSRHSVGDFDTPEGLRQAEQVLELWPRDQIGPWGRDRRSDFVRFFLDGRLTSIEPHVLERTVSSLSTVPAPIRARVALAAGDLLKAESLVRQAGSEGAFEWTDYFADLARFEISRDDLDAARAAIERISPSAKNECDVIVVRRQAGEELEPPEAAVTDESGDILTEAWSKNGMLGICVDPISMAKKTLVVDLETSGPALVEWGLNGGRRDTVRINGVDTFTLPLSGLSGRSVFYAKVLAGSPIVDRRARVE